MLFFSYVPMLGNLTILLEDTNKSAGKKKYSIKSKEHYPHDKWAISKYMLKPPANSKKGRAVRAFEQHLELFPKWDEDAMERRQAMLTKIAHKVWKLPKPKISLKWADEDE